MSNLNESHMLLEWARDLGKTHSFLDLHVHPFDVLTGDVAYQQVQPGEALYSKGSTAYHKPVVDEQMGSDNNASPLNRGSQRALLLASRLKYTHTGARVIADQLDAAGLSGALLLPVVRGPGSVTKMLEASRRMFSKQKRVYLGCPFPVGVPADQLFEFFRIAHDDYGTCAIKLHPNLAGIDPFTTTGRDLIEATLEAAGALDLPVIVHAGRTVALKPADAAEFGMVSRLETINWSLSTAPVILAHAGCYELTEEEATVALSKMDALFQKHANLMADISNLEPRSLHLVLNKVSRNRLLFGSDALYIPIWKAWLRFLRALRDVSPAPDDDLIWIASLNAAACLRIPSMLTPAGEWIGVPVASRTVQNQVQTHSKYPD